MHDPSSPTGDPAFRPVLVADNDREVVTLLTKVMNSRGLGVDACYDGAAAWEKLQEHDYSVFVCDLNMPQMTGFEVIDRLATLERSPRVIVISGYLDDGSLQDLAGRPHVALVRRKPFDIFQFADDVRAQLLTATSKA